MNFRHTDAVTIYQAGAVEGDCEQREENKRVLKCSAPGFSTSTRVAQEPATLCSQNMKSADVQSSDQLIVCGFFRVKQG